MIKSMMYLYNKNLIFFSRCWGIVGVLRIDFAGASTNSSVSIDSSSTAPKDKKKNNQILIFLFYNCGCFKYIMIIYYHIRCVIIPAVFLTHLVKAFQFFLESYYFSK